MKLAIFTTLAGIWRGGDGVPPSIRRLDLQQVNISAVFFLSDTPYVQKIGLDLNKKWFPGRKGKAGRKQFHKVEFFSLHHPSYERFTR